MTGLFSRVAADSYKSGVQPQQPIIRATIDADSPAAAAYPAAAQWAALAALSIGLGAVLVWFRVPAALFLAPMVAAIVLSVSGGSVEMPSWVAVRNVSDPQIKAEGTLQQQAHVAAQIYKGFGRWSTVCSAIVCWGLIVSS